VDVQRAVRRSVTGSRRRFTGWKKGSDPRLHDGIHIDGSASFKGHNHRVITTRITVLRLVASNKLDSFKGWLSSYVDHAQRGSLAACKPSDPCLLKPELHENIRYPGPWSRLMWISQMSPCNICFPNQPRGHEMQVPVTPMCAPIPTDIIMQDKNSVVSLAQRC